MDNKQLREDLKDKIAKTFTDAHSPPPELTVLKWPDIFADEILALFDSQLKAGKRELLEELEKKAQPTHGDMGEAVPLSIIKEKKEKV